MRNTSNLQTVIVMVKGNIGPGCLALPFFFSLIGPILSIPVIFFIGSMCVYNMWLLVHIKNHLMVRNPDLKVQTYGDLGLLIFGKSGRTFVEFCLAFMQLSICCIYVSFVSNNVAAMLCNIDPFFCSVTAIRLLMASLGLPLMLFLYHLRSMDQLVTLSFTGCICIGLGMIVITVLCILRFDHSSTGDLKEYSSAVDEVQLSQVSLFVASTVYAYEGIGLMLPIENAMEDPASYPGCLAVAMSFVSYRRLLHRIAPHFIYF